MKSKKFWIGLIICLIGISAIILIVNIPIDEEESKTKAYLYDVFHRCESLGDWVTNECSLALDSAEKVEGNYSIKMTANANQISSMRYDRTVDWSAFLSIIFSVYHPGYTNETGHIAIFTDILNYKYWNFDFAASWKEIVIDLSSAPDFSLGTLDLSNITRIEIFQMSSTTPGEDYYFDFFRGRSIDVTGNITYLKITEEMGMPSFAELKIKGESIDHFQAGLEMEVYDSDDVLSWGGRILYPEGVMEGTEVVGKLKALGIDSQFDNTYRKNFTTARDSDYVLKNVIDNSLTKYHSYDDEIDNFAPTYKYDLKTKVRKMFNYLSMLERAVIHAKPDGEIFFNKYDNLSKGPQIYQGTYNFENDAVATYDKGDEALAISGIEYCDECTIGTNDGHIAIIASEVGHKKVLKLTNTNASAVYVKNNFSEAKTAGTIEFAIKGSYCRWYAGDAAGSNLMVIARVATNLIYIYYGDGAGGVLSGTAAYDGTKWMQIKLTFSTITDTFSGWIDGVLKVDDKPFTYDGVSDGLTYSQPSLEASNQEGFYEAIGYDWEDYTVGDNLKCWDESTSKIKITSYTPSANRHITRTPVIGANNDLGQVYYVGKATDAAVQKYGINELQPWRDPEITNYAEAKQIGDNLLAIHSLDTQMIAMLVVGKGHLQVGYTLRLGWIGVFSITDKDFLLTKRVWYPMNDICEIELTDNILTRKAFNVRVINKFYDEDAQQSYDKSDVPESTIDGTVESLHSVAQLRSPTYIDALIVAITHDDRYYTETEINNLLGALNLNDLNEKSYNSLTDKPSENNAYYFIQSHGWNGFVVNQRYFPCWEVAASGTMAYFASSYRINVSGNYTVYIYYQTTATGTGSAVGVFYCANKVQPVGMSWNIADGIGCNIPIGTADRLYRKNAGSFDFVANSLLSVRWRKSLACEGTTLRIFGIVIDKN